MNHTTIKDISIETHEPTSIQPNLGIGTEGRTQVAEGLKEILSNSYLLMLKTQNYHWNIRGKMFISIHQLTETFYNDLFGAVDDIAERMRSIGHLAPGSFDEFAKYGELSPNRSKFSELEMVQDLVQANEILSRNCRKVIAIASENADEATADLLTVRLGVHEKNAWMLRSFLEA